MVLGMPKKCAGTPRVSSRIPRGSRLPRPDLGANIVTTPRASRPLHPRTGPTLSFFLAALVAPVLGALLYRTLHGKNRAVRLVDGFVYVAVPILVAIQVLPEVIEERAPSLLLFVAAGAFLPTTFELASRSLARHTDDLAIVVTLLGLILHEVLEGAALAPVGDPVEPAFAAAVILHRIPVGLILWWLVRPRHGIPMASAAVGSLVFATLLGGLLATRISLPAHGEGLHLFHAFVAGTLLHVVFHQGRHDHAHHDHDHPHHTH